jgi:hypothetical protein
MLRKTSDIVNYVLDAADGEIGRCKDFLFDDRWWTVRYMAADTRKWLPGRQVLISPISLEPPDWDEKRLPVKLTRQQIRNSPPLEADQPVSRLYEIKWFDFHGWPYYWVGPGAWGAYPEPAALYHARAEPSGETDIEPEESHLRSAREVTGYDIQAVDEGIGHVEDFFVEDTTWILRYILVDTRNWLPGKKVLLSPEWVEAVDWPERSVNVRLTSEKVRNCPEYQEPLERADERRLFEYYGFPPYWR